MSSINLHTTPLQSVHHSLFSEKNLSVDVLRLDLVHPIVSGNKWFKLKEYLRDAMEQDQDTIITFGGAYSNHIVATAAACKEVGLKSVGIIRGEKPSKPSHTLVQAMQLGMQLHFVTREEYRLKTIPPCLHISNAYLINEGGYGLNGMLGAKSILDNIDQNKYTHICCAVGTGTTLAGLIEASSSEQKCIGISALKNNFGIQNDINALLSDKNKNRFDLLHDFHFGGYAKYTEELIRFMNEWYTSTKIPSDFVYTGKLFFDIQSLTERDHFPPGSKLLLIHSGGLQGNRSLQKGTLIFGD
jgi:1-aminocyclopropane-1-carboxylate deaminase